MALIYPSTLVNPAAQGVLSAQGDRIGGRVRASIFAWSLTGQSIQIGDQLVLGTPPASQLWLYSEIICGVTLATSTITLSSQSANGASTINLSGATTYTTPGVWARFNGATIAGIGFVTTGRPILGTIGVAALPATSTLAIVHYTADT